MEGPPWCVFFSGWARGKKEGHAPVGFFFGAERPNQEVRVFVWQGFSLKSEAKKDMRKVALKGSQKRLPSMCFFSIGSQN